MHPPMFQRVIELDAAARHPRMVAALDADRGIGGDRLPRLVDLAVADEGEAREDQRLRPRPAFGEPAIDEQLVGALLCHQRPAFSVSRPGVRICGRISGRSEEHTSELQSLMRISYAVF